MKSRQQLRLEIAEQCSTLIAQQARWRQQRSERVERRHAALASPSMLAGSFAAGLTLGLLNKRRQRGRPEGQEQTQTTSKAASLLWHAGRELLPVVQPLLLTAFSYWLHDRRPAEAEEDQPPGGDPATPPAESL